MGGKKQPKANKKAGQQNPIADPKQNGAGGPSRVWILPAKGPGEASLLASFPVSVGDLEWNHDTMASSSPPLYT